MYLAGLTCHSNNVESDHIGDIRDLPLKTTLQLGPYKDRSKIEDTEKLSASLFVDEDDLKHRRIHHLSDAKWKTYGNLRGVDYFEDGSLVLLDTPGVSTEFACTEVQARTSEANVINTPIS